MPKYQVLITVLPRPILLDPEGETILGAIHRLGYAEVQAVRAGRAFILTMEAESPNVAHQRAEQIVQQLLHNPIVDTYHIHPPIEQAPSPSPQHSR